jgi:hypothetical protein
MMPFSPYVRLRPKVQFSMTSADLDHIKLQKLSGGLVPRTHIIEREVADMSGRQSQRASWNGK